MIKYSDLIKLIDKEIVSISELREITDSDVVASVEQESSDEKHPKCEKYKVQFANQEIYWVYVKEKKSFFNFF